MRLYINKFHIILLSALLIGVQACQINEIDDPNGPSLTSTEANSTIGELNNLAAGTESLMRSEMGFYYDALGIVGREYYFFTASDPRYTGELLGKGGAVLDNAGFYNTRPYAGRYRVILNANLLIEAINNTSASLNDAQKNGYVGFAETAQAISYLYALNMQYDNGIRFDVKDLNNLGPFLKYSDALDKIGQLLDDAYSKLQNAGNEFNFPLSSGFSGFNTPATFAQFNRAIKARVALYSGDKAGVLSALGDSFMDLNGDLNVGPQYYYSTAGNDVVNPVYRKPQESEALVAHPSFASDIRANDDRINKTAPRDSYKFDELTSDRDVVLYSSLDSNIPIIRNEELILMYAEANIGTNNAEAVNALDIIRTAHGLGSYTGTTTDAALVDELLYNRRYSLFGEAHRWIDMRRYNRLDQLPIDRSGDDVWKEFPRPISEIGVQGG